MSGPGVTRAAAVVVAAGRGERFGLAAKALAPLAGRPMLAWTLDALQAASRVQEVVVVAGPHTWAQIAELVAARTWSTRAVVVEGGLRRQESVAAGLRATSADLDVVLVHDAARPLATAAQFDACADLAAETGAAILAAPVCDTLKRMVDGVIAATVSRDGLWAAQTPQGFRRSALLDALKGIGDKTVTDEAALFEALGLPVAIVPSDGANLKVTFPGDVVLAEALLLRRAAEARG